MRSRKREPSINSGVRFEWSRRCFATMARKGGKIMVSFRRIKKNAKANLMMTSVLYNPDTRTTHDTLGGIRIFGKAQGHKSTKRDPYLPEKLPPRIESTIIPSHYQVTLNTKETTLHNKWD